MGGSCIQGVGFFKNDEEGMAAYARYKQSSTKASEGEQPKPMKDWSGAHAERVVLAGRLEDLSSDIKVARIKLAKPAVRSLA